MGKQLTIRDINTDKDFTLEYNRRSIQTMEAQGFVLQDIETKPATMIPLLVRGAFTMHHKGFSPSKIDKIYETISDKPAFIEALAEMYAEPLQALLDDSVKGKNSSPWTKSW